MVNFSLLEETTQESRDFSHENFKAYGFNLVSWANNHTLDYSYGGLAATENNLNRYGIIHAGAGCDLAAANAVKYLECKEGRVAFIAATSTFHESWIAGEQRPDMQGRPGVNPLRFQTINHVSAQRLEQLKEIARSCEIKIIMNGGLKMVFKSRGSLAQR